MGATALLGRLVAVNSAAVARADAGRPNPRPLDGLGWHEALVAAWPELRAEWAAFEASGRTLPRIEDLIAEHQGNEGAWRAGLLVSGGRRVPALAPWFPRTHAALAGVPALRSALWSVLDPGAELPEHRGQNAGVLRYHLGVRCGPASGLRVGATEVPYRDGRGVLFDDTEPHAAWNHGSVPRVTLFLELRRPLPPVAGLVNRAVQRALLLDHRYRLAPARAAAWQAALEPAAPASPAR